MLQYALISGVLSLVLGYSIFGKEHAKSLWTSLLSFVVMMIFNYCILPTVDWNFPFILVWGIFCGIISIACGMIVDDVRPRHFLLLTASLLYGIGLFIATSPAFNTDKYYNLMPVETSASANIKGKFSAIPLEKMSVVDEDLAKKYAQAKLSSLNIGSICEIQKGREQMLTAVINTKIVGETSSQDTVLRYDNEPIWVFPLEHKDVFKYIWYKTTPGYIIVSACREDDVNVITSLDGKDVNLKYIESAILNKDIERHVRLNGYIYSGLNDIDFEIDDHGYPFQVVTRYENKIGMSGENAIGVVTVDAQTGEIHDYSIDEAPAWIDRIQPCEFIYQNVYYNGEYLKSWWDFTNKGRKQPTGSNSMIFDKDGCFWYNGVSSKTATDGSITGFILTDSRTMKSAYYEMPGIDETIAQEIIAKNTLNGTKVYPSAPIPYEVRGIPTYFMMLKTETGEFLGYAFVSVQKRGIYSLAKSRREAERLFIKDWSEKEGNDGMNSDVVIKKSGIFTINKKAIENGQYYFIMDNVPGKEFSAVPAISPELKYSEPQHQVYIEYSEGEGGTNVISKYDNYAIDLPIPDNK